jgi:hypothetical protein
MVKIKPFPSEKKITTDQRFKNAIQNQPERYNNKKYKNGLLTEVYDKNTGLFWKKVKENGKQGWIWVS